MSIGLVSFAEGYSDDLDDKKYGLYDFLQLIWGLYPRGLYSGAIYGGNSGCGELYTKLFAV